MKAMIAVAALLVGSGLLLAHGSKPWPAPAKEKKRRNPVPATAASVQQGRMLYQGNCLLCHGEKGAGDGPWVEKLTVKPADLSDRHMMSEMTDGEIFWKVSTGRDPMPSFAENLTEEQRWHLVNYLRSLVKGSSGAAGAHDH